MGKCLCTHFIVITVTAAHGIAAVLPEREQHCLANPSIASCTLSPGSVPHTYPFEGKQGLLEVQVPVWKEPSLARLLDFHHPHLTVSGKRRIGSKECLTESHPTASPIPCASPSWVLSLTFSKLRRLGQRVCIPISGGQARSSRVNAKGKTARKEMRLPRQQN